MSKASTSPHAAGACRARRSRAVQRQHVANWTVNNTIDMHCSMGSACTCTCRQERCEHGLLCQTRDVQKRRNHACGWRAYRLRSQEAFAAHKRDQLNGRSRTMEQQCQASAHRPVPDHQKCRPTPVLHPALPAQAAGEPFAQSAGRPAVQASGYQPQSWATGGDPHGGPCCSQLPLLLQVCPATDRQTCPTGHCLRTGQCRVHRV